MKHEWRKHEKEFYMPSAKPHVIDVPAFKFFTLTGQGNPNGDAFAECVGVLYSLAYAVRMSPKKGLAPVGYFDYTVYPLEGIWDLTEEAKANRPTSFTKDDLAYKLMIRQPEFVHDDFAQQIMDLTRTKKPHPLLNSVDFECITDGLCVQMLHLGSYDDEPASFDQMEAFAKENQLIRSSKLHREIYLNDARKTAPGKLKTVLRFKVEGRV